MKVRTIDKLMLLHQALADDRLGKADVTILATVVEATHTKYGFAWASVPAIADVVGVSRRYVQVALRKLESFGYLRIEIGGRGPKSTNRYFPDVEGRTTASPLAMHRHDAKGEVDRNKGEVQTQQGRSGSSPDTSYLPSYTDTFRTHGVTLTRDALSNTKKSLQDEDQRVAATLKRLEQIQESRGLTDGEVEWLEDIVESYGGTQGDPLGGWAYRVLNT